jgi:hypothetical protein
METITDENSCLVQQRKQEQKEAQKNFERLRKNILEYKKVSNGKTKPYIKVEKTVKGSEYNVCMSHIYVRGTGKIICLYSTNNEQEAIAFKHMVNNILL